MNINLIEQDETTLQWVIELEEWFFNQKNADQDKESKISFLHSTASGPPTKLKGVGISNGVLKKKSAEFYKMNKNIEFIELIKGINDIWLNFGISEAHILSGYILSRYKKKFTEELWNLINDNWIDKIDHWISADHLCMDVFAYFPITNSPYREEIQQWVESNNHWRRRIAIVCLIKHVRTNGEAAKLLLEQVEKIKHDTNYYVRKSIPWLLRESCKTDVNSVITYVRDNIDTFNKIELRETIKKMPSNIQEEFLDLYNKGK